MCPPAPSVTSITRAVRSKTKRVPVLVHSTYSRPSTIARRAGTVKNALALLRR
ncbi:hypothetical protein M2266_006366 [Streptomyces sp. SPB162]|nr:hypothetical protein [Streptomyces sp. SPB162]